MACSPGRTRLRHALVLAAALLLAAGVAPGCRKERAGGTPPPETPRLGGTLRVLFESANVFDPAEVDDAYEALVANQIYEGLVRLDGDLGIRPGLARSWTVADDGRSYRFLLRQGVRFHDGRLVDAEAVVASITRALSPGKEHPCLAETYLLGIEGAAAYREGKAERVTGLRALGSDTLEVRLSEPLSYFLSVMCMDQLKIVPRLRPGESLNAHPVGTGPFRWLAQRPDGEILLARFEEYWGGTVYPDTLRFVVPGRPLTGAEEVAWLARGKVHVIPLAAAHRKTVENLSGFRIMRFPDFSITFIGLDARHPPLDRVEVRQAIAAAIDRPRLLTPAAAGVVNPATGILPPRMAGYQPEPKVIAYDPARARDLLARAGYGERNPLPPIPYYTGGEDTSRYERELVRQLAEAGIRLQIHSCGWAELDARIMAGRAPMFELSWLADIPDPDAVFYFLFHTGEPNNLFGFSSARVDSLLEAGRRMTPGPERFAVYRQIESLVIEQVPIVPIFTSTSLYAWNPAVRGVEPNPFGFALTPFSRVWFSADGPAAEDVTEKVR